MNLEWSDLRLFLAVARQGGLTAARIETGLSAATLGRRITALEAQMGRPLFVRRQTGYALTAAGAELLERAGEVESAIAGVARWRDGLAPERTVRISAGAWTSAFLARHITDLFSPGDAHLAFMTASARVDIGHRHADIGIRNRRPSEQWLAGRAIGTVAFALYGARGADPADRYIGLEGEAAAVPSARWLEAHCGAAIVMRATSVEVVRALVAAGAGLGVMPCFAGDADPALARVSDPIAELESEQWLVSHHEDRHSPPVRRVLSRIVALMDRHAPLFCGHQSQETPA